MKYDDIINLEHYHALSKPYMSRHDRAAQFMPFKSLKGYDDLICDEENSILEEKWNNIEYDEIIFM